MTSPTTQTAPDTVTPALTPTLRTLFRQRRFWIIAGAVIVITSLLMLVMSNAGNARGRDLSAEDPSPVGSQAIVNTLRDHGVRVTIAQSFDQAQEALAAGPATLLFADPSGFLDSDRLLDLSRAARSTVLVDPGFSLLSSLDIGVRSAGTAGNEVSDTVACRVPAAERAGSITTGRTYTTDSGTGCFGTADGGYALVVTEDETLTLLGSRAVLQNDTILQQGNAALAVGLLGTHPNLVWYLPTSADLEQTDRTSLEEATPPWLTSVLLLIVVAALASFVWRGRRFGKLVTEDLPVVVPASETRRGRARLYQRVGARTRALDALRIGTVDRISVLLGLPRQSSAEQVALAAADRLSRPRAEVFDLLIARPARTEAELVQLAQSLNELETALAMALDPSRPVSPGASPHRTDPSSLDRK